MCRKYIPAERETFAVLISQTYKLIIEHDDNSFPY